MIDLNQIVRRGVSMAPPRLVIYGPHGVGKTTLLACAPKPLVIQTEDGEGVLDVARTGVLRHYAHVADVLDSLLKQQHDFGTVGIDTLDWLEPLVWAETCTRNNWRDIEQPGFGKGYIAASDVWRELFGMFDALRRERSMMVMLLAHSEVKTFNDPTNESYDRYQIKIQKRAAELAYEWADLVGFANFETVTVSSDQGFGKKSVRGVGTGNRVLYTEERPAFYAKTRYAMPPSIPLSYAALSAALVPQQPAAAGKL